MGQCIAEEIVTLESINSGKCGISLYQVYQQKSPFFRLGVGVVDFCFHGNHQYTIAIYHNFISNIKTTCRWVSNDMSFIRLLKI